jgi:type II secretory pathway pseudopilin PulG
MSAVAANKSRRAAGEHRVGFTLVELLVGLIVIAALMAMLIVGLTKASRFARKAAAQQTLSALKQSTSTFENEMGFLPPLVYDGSDMGSFDARTRGAFSDSGPVYVDNFGRSLVDVYQLGQSQGRDFLRGSFLAVGGAPDYRDPRYSKFSLPFYLSGALGKDVDGVEGPGMSKPLPDGAWAGVGDVLGGGNTTYDPFMETGRSSARIEREYFDAVEAAELGGSQPGDIRNRLALVDGNGKAYRYYRWLHDRDPANTLDLNIPGVFIDPVTLSEAMSDPTIDVTENNVQLRGASWAIVSAGANGLFGTEQISDILDKLKLPYDAGSITPIEEALARREAAIDNVVGIGE